MNYPGLAMTRSIGDRMCKPIGVIALPEVKSYSIERDSYILIASDGVYDVITNQHLLSVF